MLGIRVKSCHKLPFRQFQAANSSARGYNGMGIGSISRKDGFIPTKGRKVPQD